MKKDSEAVLMLVNENGLSIKVIPDPEVGESRELRRLEYFRDAPVECIYPFIRTGRKVKLKAHSDKEYNLIIAFREGVEGVELLRDVKENKDDN